MNSWRSRKDLADSIAKVVDQEMGSTKRKETRKSAETRWERGFRCAELTQDGRRRSFVDAVAVVESHC